jgi:hypothetical protein
MASARSGGVTGVTADMDVDAGVLLTALEHIHRDENSFECIGVNDHSVFIGFYRIFQNLRKSISALTDSHQEISNLVIEMTSFYLIVPFKEISNLCVPCRSL